MTVLGLLVRRYGRWLVLCITAVTIPLFFQAVSLEMESDVSRFFSKDDPALEGYRYFSEKFGLADILVLVMTPSTPQEEVERFAGWLRRQPYFTHVTRPELPGDQEILLGFARERSTNLDFQAVNDHVEEVGLEIEMAGAPAEALAANRAARRDMARTGAIAAVVILVMLVMFFGDAVEPLIALLPLGFGILWMMAMARMLVGNVNILSASLPTSLLGIGIDYALHLHSGRRLVPELNPERAWAHVFRRVGPPLLVGAGTTATAFLALAFARLRGFRQLGGLGAVGLATVFIITLLMMPILHDWGRRIRVRTHVFSMEWLIRIADWATRNRLLTAGGFVLVTVPLLIFALQLQFEKDPSAYEDPSLDPMRVRTRLAEDLDISFQPILLATRTLKDERAVLQLARPYVGADKPFSRVDCLSEDLNRPGMTPRLRYFQSRDQDALSMMLYPSGDPYKGEALERIMDATETIVEQSDGKVIEVSGVPVVAQRAIALTRHDLTLTGILAGVMVTIFLTVLIRRPSIIVATLTPLAGGVIWMLGIMKLTGYSFSLANAMSMPLVIGLGVDYGVHIVYRLRRSNVHKAMAGTGRAIFISAMTTAAAFFSLCAASNPGFRAMGIAAGAGIISCLIWSVVFLPALLGQQPVTRRGRRRLPAH